MRSIFDQVSFQLSYQKKNKKMSYYLIPSVYLYITMTTTKTKSNQNEKNIFKNIFK